MNIEALKLLISNNMGTLVFAVLGAVFLTGISIKEHLDRDPKDKMGPGQYCIYCSGWVVGYPLLGFVVAIAYLSGGNEFNAWMALQIGLSSPAIIAGLASGGANILAKNGVNTESGQ